eukprot:15318884-Heterocapsa_arctica.AAC.1
MGGVLGRGRGHEAGRIPQNGARAGGGLGHNCGRRKRGTHSGRSDSPARESAIGYWQPPNGRVRARRPSRGGGLGSGEPGHHYRELLGEEARWRQRLALVIDLEVGPQEGQGAMAQ